MAATAEKTAQTAYILVDGVDSLLEEYKWVRSPANRQARVALTRASFLLRARTRQGGTERTLLEDAAILAEAARDGFDYVIEKSRVARERRAADRLWYAAQSILAFAKYRTRDGSHSYAAPLTYLQDVGAV